MSKDKRGCFTNGETLRRSRCQRKKAAVCAMPTRAPARSPAAWRTGFTGWAAISSARIHQAYLDPGHRDARDGQELNSAERKLYRPMWNRLLPHCSRPPPARAAAASRTAWTATASVALLPEPGTVASTYGRACLNAESVQEALSPRGMGHAHRAPRSRFSRAHQIPRRDLRARNAPASPASSATPSRASSRNFSPSPTSAGSMLADDGWRFCCDRPDGRTRHYHRELRGSSISKSIVDENSGRRRAAHRKSSSRPFCACSGRATPTVASIRCAPSRSRCSKILWQNAQRRPARSCAAWSAAPAFSHESTPADSLGTSTALAAIEKLIQKIQAHQLVGLRARAGRGRPGPSARKHRQRKPAPEGQKKNELGPLLE